MSDREADAPRPDGGAEDALPPPERMRECIETLRGNGVEVGAAAAALLERYVELLLAWNARVNLVSRKDQRDIWRRHILHALAVLAVRPIDRGEPCADVGSGGGLPGIPLAILMPETPFLLVDSVGKKMNAVEDIASCLGLRNVRCLRGRVEELLPRMGGEGRCATWLARAVAPLPELLRWCLAPRPEYRPRRLVAWKGGDMTAEIAAARRLAPAARIEECLLSLRGEPYFTSEKKKLVDVTFP